MNSKQLSLASLFIVISMVLAACGNGTPTSEPTQVPVVESTQVAKGDAEPTAEVTSETQTVPEGDQSTTTPEIEAEATQAVTAEAASSSSDYVSDLGFRPQSNGFNFSNYGGEEPVTNLTPVEIRRMFGDKACARLEGEECTLTPPAQQWMEQANASMNGGHCEGFAVLSLLIYEGKIDPTQFGGVDAASLQLQGNDKLQRELAYWFSTQMTSPAYDSVLHGTPTELVNKLIEAYKSGKDSETFTVGVYKADHSGGHAVTAYGVEDKGNGLYWVMVYDNNVPGAERHIEVDTNADTWQYEASPNPSIESVIYQGDASTNTFELTPSTPRLEKQRCDFCSNSATGKGSNGLAQATQDYNEVWMDGNARLLITDAAGNKLGYEGDKFYSEIPDAKANFIMGGSTLSEDVPPIYRLPEGVTFSAVLDGDNIKSVTDTIDLSMIGSGYYVALEDIVMDPGEKDYLTIDGNGKSISYRTDYTDTPAIVVGVERPKADYELTLNGDNVKSGSETKVEVDYDKGTLTFYSTSDEVSKFTFSMSRIDEQESETFEGNEFELDPNDKLILDYAGWEGQGKSLRIHYDQGGDGTIDETADMADVN